MYIIPIRSTVYSSQSASPHRTITSGRGHTISIRVNLPSHQHSGPTSPINPPASSSRPSPALFLSHLLPTRSSPSPFPSRYSHAEYAQSHPSHSPASVKDFVLLELRSVCVVYAGVRRLWGASLYLCLYLCALELGGRGYLVREGGWIYVVWVLVRRTRTQTDYLR